MIEASLLWELGPLNHSCQCGPLNVIPRISPIFACNSQIRIFDSGENNIVFLLLSKVHALSCRQRVYVVRCCAELGVNFSHNKMNSLVRNTIKWDTIMVNVAFDRKSGGRKGKAIFRIDPLHLEGGQHNQPDIILRSTDRTATLWALSSGRAKSGLVNGSPFSWAYEWPLSLLLWPLCTWASLEGRDQVMSRVGYLVLLVTEGLHFHGFPMGTVFRVYFHTLRLFMKSSHIPLLQTSLWPIFQSDLSSLPD